MEKILGKIFDELQSLKGEVTSIKNEFHDFKNEFHDFKNEFHDFKSEVNGRFERLEQSQQTVIQQVAENSEAINRIEYKLSYMNSDIELSLSKSNKNEREIERIKTSIKS
jgi:predicted  nucleic acid-binding Zn-ribbon protein